jgi:drug/metabolite transporter (DMT)-like permease
MKIPRVRIAVLLPFLAIIAAHIIWGANFVIAKITLQEFPVYALGFLRFALACLLISPFLLTEHSQSKKVRLVDLPKFFLVGLTLITFNIVFFYEGVVRISAIDSSVLTMLTPVISVLGGWWFLKEKIYGINLVGILFGFVGALVIIGLPTLFLGGLSAGSMVGAVLIILSDISFVVGAILSKQLFKNYSTLLVTTFAFFVGLITFAVPAISDFLAHPEWINNVTVLGVLGLLFIAILSSICAYFMFQWGLSKMSLYKANLFQYIEPAVAATLAVPLLGERISYSFIIGTILVILGVYWGTLGKLGHHHTQHKHIRA